MEGVLCSVQELRLDRQLQLLEVEAVGLVAGFLVGRGRLQVQTHVVKAPVVGDPEGHLLLRRALGASAVDVLLLLQVLLGGVRRDRAGLPLAAAQGLAVVAAGQRHRGRVGAARLPPVHRRLPLEARKHLPKVLGVNAMVNRHIWPGGCGQSIRNLQNNRVRAFFVHSPLAKVL